MGRPVADDLLHLASSLTSLAAGRGVELLYNRAYAATKVMETSNVPGADDGLVEFTRPLDPDQVVVDTGEEVHLDGRGLNIYEWTIPGGELYETGIFYASKGDINRHYSQSGSQGSGHHGRPP